MTAFPLAGKVALVVGAGSGWGRGCALRLAAAGAAVVACGPTASRIDATVRQVRDRGGRAEAVALPADTFDSARAIVDRTVAAFGSVDILVNAAGYRREGAVVDLTEADVERTVGAQLLAPLYCTRFAAAAMVRQGRGGRIVTVSGGAAVRATPGQSVHAATKGGVIAASLAWAEELAPHGITVNCVRGGVSSDGSRTLIEAVRRSRSPADDRALGFFPAEEAAELVVWLATPEAAHVTGRFIGIDGNTVTVWGPAPLESIGESTEPWSPALFTKRLGPRLGRRADSLADVSPGMRTKIGWEQHTGGNAT
ncbi:MAG TPA: SDR family oxidoreductase [Pseudonocardiaceae bacterium]|nr:SDR family oxidoreductase [Pseudonocardiaceae bacterium]